jgi:hypothetical protein
MTLDDAFWPALWALALETGTRPETFLAVWFAESGLEPAARNAGGCIGLNQSCPKTLGGPGFPNDDADAYASAPASAQLAWIRLQVLAAIRLNGGPFRSAARYYQANFLPATLATAKVPDDVIAARSGPLASAYVANAGLDATHDGAITLRDLGLYLQQRVASGGGVLESAIARAYAVRPAGAPWPAARLTLFEPGPAVATAASVRSGAGGLFAGLLLLLAFARFGRRA